MKARIDLRAFFLLAQATFCETTDAAGTPRVLAAGQSAAPQPYAAHAA